MLLLRSVAPVGAVNAGAVGSGPTNCASLARPGAGRLAPPVVQAHRGPADASRGHARAGPRPGGVTTTVRAAKDARQAADLLNRCFTAPRPTPG